VISSDLPCRIYIVYHNGLFAQGVRCVLEEQRVVEVVGMESDVAKALKAVRSLQPEVIIVEECTGKHQPMRLGAFLHSATAGRVVTLSLDHKFATVYQRNRIPVTDLGDLVKAIQGVAKQQIPGPDPHHLKVAMDGLFGSSFRSDDDRTDHESRVRRTRKPEDKPREIISHTARGKRELNPDEPKPGGARGRRKV
jgi:chemotaxis response regulator CheB